MADRASGEVLERVDQQVDAGRLGYDSAAAGECVAAADGAACGGAAGGVDSEASQPPDTSQRDREAALAIKAAHARDCAGAERHLRAVRAVDASYANTVVLLDHLVADCLEPYLGR